VTYTESVWTKKRAYGIANLHPTKEVFSSMFAIDTDLDQTTSRNSNGLIPDQAIKSYLAD